MAVAARAQKHWKPMSTKEVQGQTGTETSTPIEPEKRLFKRLKLMWSIAPHDLRKRLVGIYALVLTFNMAVWILLLAASSRYTILLGLAPLAYGFGLRHAVDPDHIAAIDNTTRKLMRDGDRPVGVGFFFSLGHSTVVFALSVLIGVCAALIKTHLAQLQSSGAVLGTSISGIFLIVIALINAVVLVDVYRTWRKVKNGGNYDDQSLEEYLNSRGLLARLFRPLLKLVGKSWHMYPIGIVFGLGFDTASEVGILSMSATAGGGGMPVWFVLLLPLLFVAGMSLVDTTDGVAMLGAYGWAYVKPIRKLYYNLNITLISILIALFVGGVELLQVISMETRANGGLWSVANNLPLNLLGFCIIGIFLASWLISVALYKLRRYDRLDSRPVGARVEA